MSGRPGNCRQSCCRTPFGVCAKQGNCTCHSAQKDEIRQEQLRAAQETAAAQRRIRWTESLESEWYRKHREGN